METQTPVSGDAANLEILLNSAQWEIGILITPSVEPSEDHATDESEVR
jgi:hypothetical protein